MVSADARQLQNSALSVRVLIASLGWLAVAIVPAAFAVACLQEMAITRNAMLNAAIAASICWTGGSLALYATWLGNRLGMPVQAVLGGMFFRLGIPLVGIATAPHLQRAVGLTGLGMTILGVYLITLIAETALALRLVPQAASGGRMLTPKRATLHPER